MQKLLNKNSCASTYFLFFLVYFNEKEVIHIPVAITVASLANQSLHHEKSNTLNLHKTDKLIKGIEVLRN